MAVSPRSAPALERSRRRYAERSNIEIAVVASPGAASVSVRAITSVTGHTEARQPCQTSPSSVVGTTARSTKRATAWSASPTASFASGGRTAGSCPKARCRRRCPPRSEEHTSELQSHLNLVCRLLLEKKKKTQFANDKFALQKKQNNDRTK